jgi:hypothetical protein
MKKTYVITFALMVLLSMTLSASALQYKQKTVENGDDASATWADGSNYTFLDVNAAQGQTNINVEVCGYYSCKYGFLYTNENVLSMDKKLMTATLSPVQVDLFDPSTNTDEIVTIQAQWIGVGDTTKGSYTTTSKSGDYTAKYSSDTVYRSATATGTIGLGTSQYATISFFKSVSITTMK